MSQDYASENTTTKVREGSVHMSMASISVKTKGGLTQRKSIGATSSTKKPKNVEKDPTSSLSPHGKTMSKFFPDLVHPDEYVTQFRFESRANDQLGTSKLTPKMMKYKRPDFGFNDDMVFENVDHEYDIGDQPLYKQAGWRKFMDAIAVFPQNERVKNYIDFIHNKKLDNMKAKLPPI